MLETRDGVSLLPYEEKKFFRSTGLPSIMLLSTACWYQWKVPIVEAEEKVDKYLFGNWICASDLECDSPAYYRIKKFSKVKYDVTEMSYS